MRKRKGMAVIAAIVMTAVMSLGGSLATTTTVGISDGAAGVAVNATVVGFGGHEWWVIGDASSGVYPKTNSVTLLAKDGFGNTAFNVPPDGVDHIYKGSTLQKKMDDMASKLPDKERGKINKRTLSSSDDKNYPIMGDDVADQQLWPLSKDEYDAIGSPSVRSYGSNNWLRSYSPDHYDLAYYVRGEDSKVTHNLVFGIMAARPALNLNVSSVIFTSNAGQTGKAAATAGGGLVSVTAPDTTGDGNKIKYTFRDDTNLKLGNVSVSKIEANKATVKYDGATEGKTLSVIAKEKSGSGQFYGKLSAKTAASGEGSFVVPDNFDFSKYDLEVFVEEINGDNLSDFASTPKALNIDLSTIKQVAVTGGDGGGSYTVGAEVKLKANAADTGKRFKHWEISPEVTPIQDTSFENETIMFIMPGEDVTATAVYEYNLTVTGGSGSNYYAEGEEVTITANPAPEGKRFKGWEISPEVTLTKGSLTSEEIGFKMPKRAVTATAGYEDVYTVTVNNGTISRGREYAEGEEVTLTANIAADGKRFKRWEISPEVTLTKGSLTDETITFTMPGEDVTATAGYEDVYTVTVNSGTISGGIGEYAEGEEVTLTANPAPEGKYFKGWSISPEVTLKDGGTVTSGIIKFDMPAHAVTATAEYEDKIVYPIKDGDNSTWNPGDEGGLIITTEGEYRKFTGVTVDGNMVDRQHYTVESGSTIVTLKASYLSTLSVGEHVLRIHFTDGYTETRFNVQEVQTDKPTPPITDPTEPNPPTTDPGEPTSPVNPPVQPGEANPPVQGGTTTATTVATAGTSPKTGDSNRIIALLCVMAGAAAGLALVKKRKRA